MTDVKIQDLVSRVIHHQCGFQGCRVGEASNPNPVVTRQGRWSQAFHDTHVDVSSDEESSVRRNTGRDVIATSQELREERVCTDTIIDDLEPDLTEIQPSMPGVLRVGPPTVVANRFSSLAAESDDDLEAVVPPTVPASDNAVREMLARSATPVVHIADIDSENLSDTATDPDDNEPVVVQLRRWRRLVLVPQPSGATQQSGQDLPHSTAIDTPDTHDDRLRRVRQALRQGIPSEVVQGPHHKCCTVKPEQHRSSSKNCLVA